MLNIRLMKMLKNSGFVLMAFCVLSACGGDVREDMGLKKTVPDEFAVERRPALDVPPEFKLRPPAQQTAEGAASENKDEAKAVLLGQLPSGQPTAEVGSAEKALLQKAGTDAASSDIRKQLGEDYKASEDASLLDEIDSLADSATNKTLVDAPKERERIGANKQLGKSIVDGETPSKSESGSLSVLGKILGD